jgi:hypothetical protein
MRILPTIPIEDPTAGSNREVELMGNAFNPAKVLHTRGAYFLKNCCLDP